MREYKRPNWLPYTPSGRLTRGAGARIAPDRLGSSAGTSSKNDLQEVAQRAGRHLLLVCDGALRRRAARRLNLSRRLLQLQRERAPRFAVRSSARRIKLVSARLFPGAASASSVASYTGSPGRR